MSKNSSNDQISNARKYLLKYLKPGSQVFVVCTHISSSGMMRNIQVLIPYKKEILDLSYEAAIVLGWGMGKRGGVKVSGCGMDMGFHLVSSLGGRLWPDGTKKPHGERNGEPDTSGYYALKHRWV